MIFKSYQPCASLRGFVRNYTIINMQFSDSGVPPSKQRSPKPEQKIVFYLKGCPQISSPSTGNPHFPPKVSIYNHQIEQRNIKLSAQFFAFIIFLRPGVLHKLLRLPMDLLLSEAVDAELFFGSEVRDVSEQLESAGSYPLMIDVADKYLESKCSRLKMNDPLDKIAAELLDDPTRFSLNEVATQACLSSRQFYRRFTEHIGLTPKLFSRLSRFNLAYKYKIDHPSISWSGIAQEFCYTDYHHLEKEFKEFTGRTPQEWLNTHLNAPERILGLR
ncbi:MAG: AraC family transcriptional regulator [Sphingobacteriales bacterium]|nr:MAG: AraC family transcriptional regulator [Sphingobacteriales bacterium]